MLEGFVLALQEIWGNKLRSFLSVLGITIGIFCIVAVFMMVDSIEKSIRGSLSRLGDNVVYVHRFPWDGGHGDWWKYLKRPYPSYKDFKAIKEKAVLADRTAIRIMLFGKEVKYKKNKVQNVKVTAMSHDFGDVFNLAFEQGRFFSKQETTKGHSSVIMGADLAKALFPSIPDPIGRTVKVMGRNMTLVGVLKREGKSIFGDTFDDDVMLPYNYMRRYVDVNSKQVMPLIAVRAAEEVTIDELKDELRVLVRANRKLKPKEVDNFSLNQVSLLNNFLDQIFAVVNVAGICIGIFSLLVGGFGIANIMFVSVKERTHIIGIKKSLGAKRHFILFEFLIESICLCILGGLLGILMVLGIVFVGNWIIESFSLVLSVYNMGLGIGISVGIGLVAGFLPALRAAAMNPVEAIRSK